MRKNGVVMKAGIVAVLALAATAGVAQDGVISVKVGVAVPRTYDDVKAANYAYGPKQDVEGEETRIYLPYGNNPKLYFGEVKGLLTDCKADALAEFFSKSSAEPASLTYKLEFDKEISEFRFTAGYAEVVSAPTCVAGLEYSTDGIMWKTVKETPKGTRAVVAPFVDKNTKTAVGKTKTLYLRIYSRDSENPAAESGPEMYLKMRISGDPRWGDIVTTFFPATPQLWVK